MSVDDDTRDAEERKRDRQMIELLNELRVALPGVQILFAFLLTVPFTQRFSQLTPFQVDTFYVTLVAATVSAGCLIAPSAAHRLRFHQQEREWLIESANALMIAGLAFLAVAIAAPLGDLFESQVKRDANTKDAGRLFGVHGGALDRLDAAFFALVAGYYVWGAML